MSTLTDIKAKINVLEGGAFQELCGALLSCKGYKGIHAYGMQAGTMKTTKGNPDTYFKSKTGKYIFVECTTQKDGLFRKAKEDIEKCLDPMKTGVQPENIEEIIFCHTSSQLSPGEDQDLKAICAAKGVLFSIYGIDRIADEIYRNHKILARDYLGMKYPLFRNRKMVAIALSIFLVTAVAFGFLAQLGSSLSKHMVNNFPVTINSEFDEHLLLDLANANHTYETGLVNWRRLDYARAERDISLARSEISESVAQSEIEAAKINNSLGCLYLDMGRYEEAYDYLNKAYVVFRDTYGDDSVEARASLFSIAQYDYNTGDFESALKTCQFIIDRSDEEKDLVILTSVKHLQALIHDSLGDYDSAIDVYGEVLEMYDEFLVNGSLTEELANYTQDSSLTRNEKDAYTCTVRWIIITYSNMGQVYIRKNDYENAFFYLQTGLDLIRGNEYILEKELSTAKIYMNIAKAKAGLGLLKEAVDDVDKAMRIERSLFNYKSTYPGLVEVYDVYGNLLAVEGKEDEASDYYNQALDLALNSFGINHPQTAEAYNAIGEFCLDEEKYDEAEGYFIKAIEIRKNILDADHPTIVRYFLNLSFAQAKLYKIGEAKDNYDEALRISEYLGLAEDCLVRLNEIQKLLGDN